jgi:hypothetical protein
MLVYIDDSSATLTPFGSLARHISVFSQTRQKRSDEIPAEPQS